MAKKRKYSSARDRVRQEAAKKGPGGGSGTMFNLPEGVDYYNPEKGRVTLRLLPYPVTDKKHPDGALAPKDSLWYKRPMKRFRQVGVEKKSMISPLSVGKPCPIYEYYKEAKADPNIPDKEAGRAKPQDMVMYNVQIIDKNGKASDPMFFWYSYALFEKHLKVELNDPDNEEFLAFMDLEGGFDIKVRWEEEVFDKNPYLEVSRISFVERDDDIDEDILDDVINLDEVLVIKDYKELQNIFLEIDDDDDTDDDASDDVPNASDDPAPLDVDELVDMSKSEMKKFIKKQDLDIKVAGLDEDELREEIADELGIKLPVEKEEEKKLECPNDMDFGDDFGSKNKCKRCDVKDECKAASKESSSGDDDTKEGECPHGHTFGKDCDDKKECDTCDVWEACMDKQEGK